ncbi:MAG: ABC transporter transmembrane domain-containing protein [Pseudomonadota bacterium]
MDSTIFKFIWKHSLHQQIVLLAVTLCYFPFLYVSLEIPKLIINDAIGAESERIAIAGTELSQVEYLFLLCFGFLGAVLASGLVKMRMNTMKGVLAERMLQKLRQQLIQRILRFPPSYFRRTSQGELVSMVTSEAEPLGGLMGDALAQPVFQGGMMLTIMAFLFVQNPWLGLAAIALIPLQAWLIPLLQRRINALNKERVQAVRRLATTIGESAAGASELRINGGWRFMLNRVGGQLDRLFSIRLNIYQQKFFMKFLNNFINQLTPFFFFLIGGYLAIQGSLSVGALVAALAAYKDLSAPWKELLAYYNRCQDMAVRWDTIIERFDPSGIFDAERLTPAEQDPPHLTGPIAFKDLTVRDADGSAILEGIDLDIPSGATVAIESTSARERHTFLQLLTREIVPSSGEIRIDGQSLSEIHPDGVALRLGTVSARPFLFNGTVGQNILISLDRSEFSSDAPIGRMSVKAATPSLPETTAPRLALAGLSGDEELREWWHAITEVMGTDDFLLQRGLDARFDPADRPELAKDILRLRPLVAERLAQEDLSSAVATFDPGAFHPGLPIAGNLMFALPRREIGQERLARNPLFVERIRSLGLEEDILAFARAIMSLFSTVFGEGGTSHPLFHQLRADVALFERLTEIAAKADRHGLPKLSAEEHALLLTVPFRFSTDQINAPFPQDLKDKILNLRETHGDRLLKESELFFARIDPDALAERLTVLENLLFGKLLQSTKNKAQAVRAVVVSILREHGLHKAVAHLIYDVETGIGGTNLPEIAHERIAFVRATVKRPDVLILDRALPSHPPADRIATRRRLRALLPDATIIYLEDRFDQIEDFDLHLRINEGHIASASTAVDPGGETGMTEDLRRKMRALETVPLFRDLERRQLRLLAFGSTWFTAQPSERVFSAGEQSDSAYLIVKGSAELYWDESTGVEGALTTFEPGRLVGDMSVVRNAKREHNLIAKADLKCLRIDGETLRSIIENDMNVALSLLRTVAGHMVTLDTRLRAERQRGGEHA